LSYSPGLPGRVLSHDDRVALSREPRPGGLRAGPDASLPLPETLLGQLASSAPVALGQDFDPKKGLRGQRKYTTMQNAKIANIQAVQKWRDETNKEKSRAEAYVPQGNFLM
jgi:hypothetical protein